jgi:hypothetical protein
VTKAIKGAANILAGVKIVQIHYINRRQKMYVMWYFCAVDGESKKVQWGYIKYHEWWCHE